MKVIKINNRFKTSRVNAGYTQRDVSKILEFLSYKQLSNYENGKRDPSNMVLYSLPKLYHVSLEYLLCQDKYRSHEEYAEETLGLTTDSITLLKHAKKTNISLKELKSNILNLIKTR